ncbi:hypothetical protein [Aureimonas sp. Leaf324]|uniref:hypothetical protein n=1 Tax=Aureimonas sp. Leaf324 TaxID=1736336 RepID=UPI0009E72EE0|nr:hypothetical protein [Aureimonas sp. Leaf324]
MKLQTIGALVSVLLAVSLPPAGAADLPFQGRWSGGPATCQTPFSFTPSRYTAPGSRPIKVAKVERDGRNFLLSFPDGYRVALFDVSRKSMTWHSPISGDTFELTRCS